MAIDRKTSFQGKIKKFVIGKDLDLGDRRIFHSLSLIAFFAWVGLGADGLSSSCYGPSEAFQALGAHPHLAVFVALATGLTICIISASYSQIIEHFPTGGGGYIVATKLLSPAIGMVSGCALLIDYALTITLSVASGADAIFSFLPETWAAHRLDFALAGVVVLLVLNLRGVKESVMVLVPIFMVFVITHAIVLGYGLGVHAVEIPAHVARISEGIAVSRSQLGFWGVIMLIMHSYSMGAGTYTGIEAVSNGLPILREPKVRTGKRTMLYMAVSLAVTVMGLMFAYLLFNVQEQPGKTLNAVLFDAITTSWPEPWNYSFVLVTLVSEAALLFVAAQTGFLDGPRVLSNMALDRWFPTRFAMLSDRLVTKNGILLMGASALFLMIATKGSVDLLIVLYSINVFITFVLSQLGMVKHWWRDRRVSPGWIKGLCLNGLGLALCSFILAMVVIVKFGEGGWVTMLVTSAFAAFAWFTKRHYNQTWEQLKQLDVLVEAARIAPRAGKKECPGGAILAECDANARTAVLLVNGYNGLGLHTLGTIMRYFEGDFDNFIFIQVGQVDAGTFKTAEELDELKRKMEAGLNRYVQLLEQSGYYAEAHWVVGTDVNKEILDLAPVLAERFPRVVFFGGQLVFEQDTFFTRLLHNYTVFTLQREFYRLAIPFMILPVRLATGVPEGNKEAA
ncbi:MAG: APC family permease [Desulfovibrionaceae bacterium]|nr:APC family permease [Desulfovibrionaceae bacterium]MBF0513782.1 APC family permease [Desulfovibrionaceae bacterium]